MGFTKATISNSFSYVSNGFIQKTRKDFLDEHPDELAKVKSTASQVLNSSQKAIEKQAKKLDISTNFSNKLPASSETTSTTKSATNTHKPPVPVPELVPAPTETPPETPTPAPEPTPV